jgi:hypothetical protein
MPRPPKGQKRVAEVVGSAFDPMRFARDRDAQAAADDGKDKAAQYLGQRGGKARALALSKKRRKEIAQAAAAKRWAK